MYQTPQVTAGFVLSIIGMVVAVIILFSVTLIMALVEGAVVRVTRASLNNLMLEVRTDNDISQFTRMKIIAQIHRVQSLIANRNTTIGSCSFVRITCNIAIGVLVACISSLCGAPVYLQIVCGILVALIAGFIGVLLHPRSTGGDQPVQAMLRYARLVSCIVMLTPFARYKSDRSLKHDNAKEKDLSDEEVLEKIQLEQGRATIDRLVEVYDFDAEVSEMLRNVLTLSDTLTREIMVPRTDMVCIEKTDGLEDLLQLCSRSGFSRVPIIGDSVDDMIGMAYLKDAVRATAFNSSALKRTVDTIGRDMMLVPESKPVDDLFHEMQRTRQHVAVVVDEYGGIAGLVTIEDAIEQIVGELEDEHDRIQHEAPQKIGSNTWKMPSRTSINTLEELFEVDIEEDDVDTVFGLLTKILGRMPIVGSSAVTHGLRLTAADSAGRRKKISTIIVEPANEDEDNKSTKNESDS